MPPSLALALSLGCLLLIALGLFRRSRRILAENAQLARSVRDLAAEPERAGAAPGEEARVAAEPFHPRALLASVRAELSAASEQALRPIDLVVDPTVPAVLVGDEAKLRQILIHYVRSAFRPAGRGRVTISAFAALCGADRYDLTFVVGDEGPGPGPADDLQNVELGLSGCRALAERMGGTILARSEVGKGAFLYLRVPLPLGETAPEPVPADLRFAGPMYALVVEEEPFSSAGLVAMLRHLGINTEVSTSGEAALERCRVQAFALFFLDRDLPGMSGLELALELRRQDGQERHSMIIATSGADTRQGQAECLAAGMDEFLTKPATLEKLRAALGRAFAPRGETPGVRPFLGAGKPAEPWRLDTLRYLANGDPGELVRRARLYVRELDAYVLELQAAVAERNFHRLRRSAHGLVGHLGIIEHVGLLSAVQQIEESAVNRDLEAAVATLTEVLSSAHYVRSRLVADSENARFE